ncbi:MAG TPA: hypothetical protein VHX38_32535 [Pseudonocardiaceae bacterium]|jgi:hypothetical protein|nr:hypothetical protein [Pseudonocardiaceae bacterium]
MTPANDDPSKYWSKALGFGFDEPVTDKVIAQVCEFYRDNGNAQATLQIAPTLLPPDWAEICARHNITEGGAWTKLMREAGKLPAVDTTLRIGRIEPDQAAGWAVTVVRGFGMPENEIIAMVTAFATAEGVNAYGAWDGADLVGVGTLVILPDVARHKVGTFFAGATLPTHRHRGAQSALFEIRARDAVDAGCTVFTTETGREGPGEHNSSLHNMLRAGFRPVYDRQNWAWHAA